MHRGPLRSLRSQNAQFQEPDSTLNNPFQRLDKPDHLRKLQAYEHLQMKQIEHIRHKKLTSATLRVTLRACDVMKQ
jgi:hypothetical protein